MISADENRQNEKKEGTENDKKKEGTMLQKFDVDDVKIINLLNKMYKALNGDIINLHDVKNSIELLSRFNQKQEYCYLNNLLYPEKSKNVKIPSPIPVPSCAFQLHNCITLSTNSSGNVGVVFNPFFLSSNTFLERTISAPVAGLPDLTGKFSYFTTLWVDNNDSLSGSAPDGGFRPFNIGQCIPAVYDQYRLVSASVVVKYIGRLDITSGVIGGAIVFDEDMHIGGGFTDTGGVNYTTSGINFAKYGNFDLAMDSFYHQENLTLEGIRELYFPLDNSYEEYFKLFSDALPTYQNPPGLFTITAEDDYYKSGFNFFIYTLGAPSNSACLKLDIYCNYECLPNASFMNYLPISMTPYPVSPEEKRSANVIIQQKPIMKVKEGEKEDYSTTPGIFNKMINKFGGFIPSFKKMANYGLINSIPFFKGGLTLAGSMLSNQMEEEIE